MSGAALLAALSALAGAAAARELLADYGELARERLRRHARRIGGHEAAGRAGRALDLGGRIRRAGLDGRLGVRWVLAAKLVGACGGGVLWALSGPSMPPRLAALLLVLCLLAGFLLPDVILERRARERASAIRSALADCLDLIAIEVGSGVAVPRSIARAAARGRGPLADELGRAVAAIEAGEAPAAVLAGLGEATRIDELTLAGRALERAHRLGAPLGEELRAQAGALRRASSRAVREAADRAGPKIQLVVALVLVPAVLLVIVAALVAHAGSLLGGL